MPEGATRVVIQEDVRREGDEIAARREPRCGTARARPPARDFAEGDEMAPRRLRPADIALLAAMNVERVPVVRRPVVALIPTGDELAMPGEVPAPDQIIASNAFGLAAMLEAAGAEARLLPIARDNAEALGYVLGLAAGADLVVTIGGASVGDHDIVARVAESRGLARTFHKVAMRPGKPLMAGRIGGAAMLGLPGNPVAAMVCGMVFAVPMLRAMLGLGRGSAAAAARRPGGPARRERPARALHARAG